MEISDSGKDSNQMLHALLSSESNENVDFSSSHYNSHEQTQQLQSDPQLNLDELHWHPHPSSVQTCEETVEVFSIGDSYVWQNTTSQEDSEGCLQSLATPLPERNIIQENNLNISQPSKNVIKPLKKREKEKSMCSSVNGRNVKKKGATGRKVPTSSQKTICEETEKLPSNIVKSTVTSAVGYTKESSESMKSTIIEDDVSQVRKKFSLGCECHDSNCFDGLNPETVFRHRLNIAELTKDEHDMYLMGLTMACLSDWAHTNRNKERQRLRANYVHQGRSVCLQAFLYLENCTCYQVKRIRKHVMTHGVVPRIHGNHGKRPHNSFALEIYCHATEFLKSFVQENSGKDSQSKNAPIFLGPDVTRKSVHQGYLEYCRKNAANVKVMSYSTFRHFMKEQFPQIRFRVVDGPGALKEGIKQTSQFTPSQNHVPQPNSDSTQESVKNVNKTTSSNHQDVEVLTFAQVLMNDTQHMIDSNQEMQSRHEGPGNIVVIDALPLDSTTSFVSPSVNNRSTNSCPGSNNSKLLTFNSSSLCLVNSPNVSNVNSPALVPFNTFAVLGTNVIPFVLDSKESKDLVSDT